MLDTLYPARDESVTTHEAASSAANKPKEKRVEIIFTDDKKGKFQSVTADAEITTSLPGDGFANANITAYGETEAEAREKFNRVAADLVARLNVIEEES